MYKIHIKSKVIESIEESSLDQLKLEERNDLQQWIKKNPEILSKHFETDFLIISEELDKFEINDRLDLLAIDKTGALVIIELKRNHSGSTIDVQGLKYASYCSTLLPADVLEIYSNYIKKNKLEIDPRESILDFLSEEKDEDSALSLLNSSQKIVLVSQSFDKRVKSVCAYLASLEVDISCVEFKISKDIDSLYIDTLKIIPPESIDSYLVKSNLPESKTKNSKTKLVPQPKDILDFYSSYTQILDSKYELHGRRVPHVKYCTFKAGSQSLEFSFDIMKKTKNYKICLISKDPSHSLVDMFFKEQKNLLLIKDYKYEVSRIDESKSNWERIYIIVEPIKYLEDMDFCAEITNNFINSLKPFIGKLS
jgi:hypothetical protein